MSDQILSLLQRVERERERRQAEPDLARRVLALKAYQQRRFERTYRDLLEDPRHRPAARFFLDDLYGPAEFRDRDQQFARIVPKIDRLFPADVNEVVLDLARLHALSERLDTEMAIHLPGTAIGRLDYVQAWREVGCLAERFQQLDLVLSIGRALDVLTRHGWLVNALRLMRAPARAAGLGALQLFLESGMASFRSMQGASLLLSLIDQRERRLLDLLFSAHAADIEDLPPA
jgi:hypothetical protein